MAYCFYILAVCIIDIVLACAEDATPAFTNFMWGHSCFSAILIAFMLNTVTACVNTCFGDRLTENA